MKLYISQNIKRLRQSRTMTQEELAESLGVSFQSISRWENDLSYPDIELIPEIAAFFEVSTDELMGVEKATIEQNLAEDMKRIRMDFFNSDEERLELLREMHRKYPHDDEVLIQLIWTLSSFPKFSDELLKKIRQYLCHPKAKKVYIDQAIRLLIAFEEENSLSELLESYATEEDMNRCSLLEYRALRRNDHKAYKKYSQLNHLRLIYKILHDIHPTFCPPLFINNNDTDKQIKKALGIINMLTDYQGENIIVGDGEPDLWYGSRISYGFQLAGIYALKGKNNEALRVIESVVDLAEKFYSLTEGTVLTFRSSEFSELFETIRYGVRNPDDVEDFTNNLYQCMRSDEAFCGVDLMYHRPDGEEEFDHHVECAVWDIFPLINTESWSCFNSIRDDIRFKDCILRMKKHIVPINS